MKYYSTTLLQRKWKEKRNKKLPQFSFHRMYADSPQIIKLKAVKGGGEGKP